MVRYSEGTSIILQSDDKVPKWPKPVLQQEQRSYNLRPRENLKLILILIVSLIHVFRFKHDKSHAFIMTLLEIVPLQVMVDCLSITNKLLNLTLPILSRICSNKLVLSCIFQL